MSIRSLWAMIQEDPTFMRRVNGWLTVVWALMIPVAWLTGWLESVIFISAASIYANLAGHWAAWQAARVEEKQERSNRG
jgi:hypothetical protein